MFHQTDPEIQKLLGKTFAPDNLHRWGCYALSIYNLVETITGDKIHKIDLVNILKKAYVEGFIDSEFFIKKPNEFIKLFNPNFYYVGKVSAKEIKEEEKSLSIECYTDKRRHKHFRLSHFDSYEGGTQVEKNGWLDSYRVYGKKLDK